MATITIGVPGNEDAIKVSSEVFRKLVVGARYHYEKLNRLEGGLPASEHAAMILAQDLEYAFSKI